MDVPKQILSFSGGLRADISAQVIFQEMVGHAAIEDDCFIANVDLDESIIQAHEVNGLADAPQKLKDLDRLATDNISIITVLEIGAEGQIGLSKVGVTGPRESKKIPAQKLFPIARLRMKPDWRGYNFPPGRTISEWMSSDSLEWSIMRTNNLNGGLYEIEDHAAMGVTPWSSRLVVNPTREAGEAVMHLVAVPRPKNQLGGLPGNATGDGSTGYPVVLLGTFRASYAGQLDQPRGDGLPYYPAFVNRGPPGAMEMPEHAAVRSVMRGLWSSCHKPNTYAVQDWITATAGPREPEQPLILADWAWPGATDATDQQSDSGE